MTLLRPGAAALLALLVAACASHLGRPASAMSPTLVTSEFEVLRDRIYTPADWPEALAADVYRPLRPGPHPAVLVVHGGGWERRSPADMVEICEYLAARGFVAVNLAHRFAPQYQFPAQLHDLQQAMRWLHANATELSIDPARIGAFGYSSGAHLVMLLAVVNDGDPLDQPHGGAATRLSAVVAGGAPVDLRTWPDGKLTRQFVGAPPDQRPELWAASSPIVHVTADDPPIFLYHGGADAIVDAEQARRMKRRLDAAGVPAELYIVPYHGHLSMFALNNSAIRRGTDFLARMLLK